MVITRVSLLGIENSDLLVCSRSLDLPCVRIAVMNGVQGAKTARHRDVTGAGTAADPCARTNQRRACYAEHGDDAIT